MEWIFYIHIYIHVKILRLDIYLYIKRIKVLTTTPVFRLHNTFIHFTLFFYFSLQFQYGKHWATKHLNEGEGDMTEILLGEDEVLSGIASKAGNIIDSIQFTTNMRSFRRIGITSDFNMFISASELLYFTGSRFHFAGLRVSSLVALSVTCSTD